MLNNKIKKLKKIKDEKKNCYARRPIANSTILFGFVNIIFS